MFKYDACIIGTGRVGLPLGLSLVESGLKTVGVDLDKNLLNTINSGKMPFKEPGYKKIIASKKFIVYESDKQVVPYSANIIITVGTPLHNHIEVDFSQIKSVLDNMIPHLKKSQLIIVRSTVGPGTTLYIKKFIENNTTFKIGKDIFLAFCPERIKEGAAYTELRSLPQICGAEDAKSLAAATKFFSNLTTEIMKTNFATAELVKLFNNISRYINFAIANQFTLIAEDFKVNIYDAIHLANHNYPRCNIDTPGLAAGTCLRKDFGMINEWNPYPDLLLSAWKINECMPVMLLKNLTPYIDIYNKKIAIMGYVFKKDTDDIRDSLVPKLYRYIQRKLPAELRVTDSNITSPIHDPSLPQPLKNWNLKQALDGADCVFIAINHSGYQQVLQKLGKTSPKVWIVDIWNVGGINKIYYQAGSLT